MKRDDTDTIKQREIAFTDFHPDPNQAETAAQMLIEISGVLEAHSAGPTLLIVRYNVLEISLEQIERGLIDTGFHLSGRLLHKLKRALYYYTEETQRANCGCSDADMSQTTREIFIKYHSNRAHGCKDLRPEHWRHYH
ncbi:MAG: hypothetical protein MI754_14775 [Chromatiales bacterium]|nr:hypothetical protein [Chromatiales bacterium]